jgi:2-oxoglutarate dehydrogenase complex dehydrogenase (E1) component-like enzyme
MHPPLHARSFVLLRLNVLHNVLQVPFETIAEKFQPLLPDDGELPSNSDDVRYHLGCLVDYCTPTRTLHVSLASNPSHLEAVNAVVLGKTRARQFLQRGGAQEDRAAIVDGVVTPTGASTSDALGRGVQRPTTNNSGPLGMRGSVDYSPGDCARKEVMALLVHGDASFFQGSVRESLGFANLRDYSTGGTVHVIVNNQIGFTTMPKESHSSVYCSDVAKATGAPVFHVNGDDPDAVVHVFKLAVDYRQAFERDVVVNLWGYRRHGHNEQDTPELTQPVMYNTIKKHTPVTELYFESLLKEGAVEADHLERLYDRIDDELAQCCSILEREVESEATCGQGRAKIDAKGREQEHKVGSIGGGGGDLREKGEAVGKHLKQSVLGFWHELRQAWPSESQRQQEQEQGGEQQPQHRSSRETRSDGGMMADAAGQALGGGGAESSLPNAACEVETVGRQSAAPPSQVQSLQEAQDLCLLDQVRTGVHLSALRTIGEAVFTLPPSDIFCAHARVIDIYDKRLKALSTGQGIRWADAEALAFASLLSQGFHVRLSGQDVERGELFLHVGLVRVS